jgi:Zn-finger nucleic acid-binding protein
VVEYEGIELDLCPGCRGVWFDRGELELILGHGQALPQTEAVTGEKRRRCPLCRKKMDKVNIGPDRRVLIDACPEGCGLWFDSGELRQLTGSLEQEGWRVAPEVREFLRDMFPDKSDEDSSSPGGV